MKYSLAAVLVLASCILFYPLQSLALHHEETGTIPAGAEYPNDEGKVVDILNTTGYTYMQLQNGDRRFWIAAPTTEVDLGDHIRFVESMSMENFNSPTLDRTFRRLIFVTSTMIKK